jgi:PAS domain S-box-containing protein
MPHPDMQEPASAPPLAFGSLETAAPELVRNIVDSVPTLIAYFDSGLICRYGNASYRQMFSPLGNTLEGASFESLVLPHMCDEIMPRAHAALRGEKQNFEYTRDGPNGQPLHVEVKYTPDIRQGQVHGMFVELHDITHHKRIEDLVLETNRDLEERVQERTVKLFESEQRFRLMVDGLKDYCIYFLDEQGQITDWTESAQRMHAVPPHQALRQHLGVLMDAAHPARNASVRTQLIRQAIDHGQSETDGWQIRQDQPAFWAHTTLTALRNSLGELQGLSVITKDMTATKRLEEVMTDLNNELERRMSERTEELSAANRDIDAFSHMVSHDLRAPLRHLSGYLTLMREELEELAPVLPANGLAQHVKTMEKSSARLTRMIEGVLDYSRLGRNPIQPMDVPLGPLVQAEVAKAQAASRASAVWQVATAWPNVQGDAALLSRLLACLLDNAVKYTGRTEQPLIELGWNERTASETPPSGFKQAARRVTFWVRDNGAGFDRERASSLFVMFQRQHHSMDFDGTGTGLALSQRIVELHRGTIRIESRTGQGCTVRVTLPAGTAPD